MTFPEEIPKSNVISHILSHDDPRYCTICHVQCIRNPDNLIAERDITYLCPSCGVRSAIQDTERGPKLNITFSAFSPFNPSSSAFTLAQNKDDAQPRHEYFIKKRKRQSRETDGYKDPYMQYMTNRTDIHINRIEYYDPVE